MLLAPLVLSLLLVNAALPPQSADEDYAQAWYALEVTRDPEAARAQFEALLGSDLSPALRARAALGLARCERLLGRPDDARARLTQLAQESADLPGVAAEVQAELALLAGDHSRYITGIETLRAGQFLDLDTGGLSSARDNGTGNGPEISMEGGVLRFAVIRMDMPGPSVTEMSGATPWLGDAPWLSVVTDGGRDAWLQPLNAPPLGQTQADLVVRYVTRLTGAGAVLPAPRDPFCVASADGIDVWFTPSDSYVSYRVERRISIEGAFAPGTTLQAPPYHDTDVQDGWRYGYRITGITSTGDEGIPVTVQGTTASHGAVSGRCVFTTWPQSWDFLEGAFVERGGDLTFTGLYGSRNSASFRDSWGRPVSGSTEGGTSLVSPWQGIQRDEAWARVGPDEGFVTGLAGGGVVRCRLSLPEDVPDVILDYTLYPDGDVFPPGPALVAGVRSGTAGTVEIAVTPPAGYVVTELLARDLVTGSPERVLEVVQGFARDSAAPSSLIEYSASGVDSHGRRSAEGVAIVNLLPGGITSGEFEFHYEQGFSIERQELVPVPEADVVFQSAAGGISSVTLSAVGGIVNLEQALREAGTGLSSAEILEHLLAADPGSVTLDTRANGDAREPASDVFVLRTRHGGWAALAITRRGTTGGWTEKLVSVSYRFNAHEPVFGDLTRPHETLEGLTFASLPRPEPPPAAEAPGPPLHPQLEWPVASAPATPPPLPDAGGLEPAHVQTGTVQLLARSRHNDYEKATFSFEFGVRDDPGNKLTHNDWELQFGNGDDVLDVNMVSDDRSTIADLGALSFADLTTLSPPLVTPVSELEARVGHVYVVQTRDTGSRHASLFRVEELVPGDTCTIAWVDLRAGGGATDPLGLGNELRLRLGRLLLQATP